MSKSKDRVMYSAAAIVLIGSITAFAVKPPDNPVVLDNPVVREKGISVYFSPNGGCTNAIVEYINQATKSVKIQAYIFTSVPIAEAVIEAKRRGIEVIVMLDSSRSRRKYSTARYFAEEDMTVYVDYAHAIAHNKITIIDDSIVITGSFNFSKSAEERTAENIVVIQDHPQIIDAYIKNFEKHLEHSVHYDLEVVVSREKIIAISNAFHANDCVRNVKECMLCKK